MRKIIFYSFIIAVFTTITTSCKSQLIAEDVGGYFTKNTIEDGTIETIINSQNDFDKYFGVAMVMGENKPTVIDFESDFVIAVILPITNKTTNINTNIEDKGDFIEFSYQVSEGETQSFTTRPTILKAIDRKHLKEVKFEKQ